MRDSGKLLAQVLRYLVGGASTTVLTWGCVWLFVEHLDLHYLVSTNLATLVAYGYSYIVNKLFVFGDRDSNHVVKGSRFIALQLALLVFANAFMFTSVSLLGVHYMVAVVIVSVLAAILNFSLMKLLVFTSAPSAIDGDQRAQASNNEVS